MGTLTATASRNPVKSQSWSPGDTGCARSAAREKFGRPVDPAWARPRPAMARSMASPPARLKMRNLAAAARFSSWPKTPMSRNMGTSWNSQKSANKNRSRARKMPLAEACDASRQKK